MKNTLFFLLVFEFALGTWAQTEVHHETAQELRRAELRAALQTSRAWPAPDKYQAKALAPENVPTQRRLTELERADLRQQLRLQRSESNPRF